MDASEAGGVGDRFLVIFTDQRLSGLIKPTPSYHTCLNNSQTITAQSGAT